MPIRRRIALMSVAGSARSTPSTVTVSESGISRRLQQRSSVLFPEPDGPMMKTVSCFRTERSIPFRISFAPKLLRRPLTSRIGGARFISRASAAICLVRCAIVPGKARHTMPRCRRYRGRSGGRSDAEPFLMQLGDGAVDLEAFERLIEGVAQRGGVLAQGDRPHQPGRIEITELQLRVVLGGPCDHRVARDIGVSAPGDYRLHGVGLGSKRFNRPADLGREIARPRIVSRALVDRDDLP